MKWVHTGVDTCGVVGISAPYKVQVAKASIVLKNGIKATSEVKMHKRSL